MVKTSGPWPPTLTTVPRRPRSTATTTRARARSCRPSSRRRPSPPTPTRSSWTWRRGRTRRVLRALRHAQSRPVADVVSALEGTERAVVTASGMGAITTMALALLHADDHVVVQRSIYPGTTGLVNGLLGEVRRHLDPGQSDRRRSLRRGAAARDPSRPPRDPQQSVARAYRHSPVLRHCPRARRARGGRQHRGDAHQPAAARSRRRPDLAQRHQVPRRPLRRLGGGDHRASRRNRTDLAHPPHGGSGARTLRRVASAARHAHLGVARGAPQRERHGRRRGAQWAPRGDRDPLPRPGLAPPARARPIQMGVRRSALLQRARRRAEGRSTPGRAAPDDAGRRAWARSTRSRIVPRRCGSTRPVCATRTSRKD